MNRTFESGLYFSLPLLAVVLAAPIEELRLSRRAVMAWVATAGLFFLSHVGLNAVRVANSWAGRDPQAIRSFIDRHTKAGDIVVGPGTRYFFAVEGSHAIYRSVYPESWADWARWVPAVEPDTLVPPAEREHRESTNNRYLVWPSDEDLPAGWGCAAAHVVGRFTPAGDYLDLPDFFTTTDRYLDTVLFSLPEGCPTGYDPTRLSDRDADTPAEATEFQGAAR